MKKVWQKVREGWKAVVALAIPIAFGAASDLVEAVGEWVATQPGLWTGTVLGALSAIGVWLKRNAPQT